MSTDTLLVNFIHDELIFETVPEKAEYVRDFVCRAITETGEELKLKCPMSGEGKIGLNWSEIH